jgi:translation initiation factor IF-3
MIDDHDYDVKMRAMQRFFEEGDKVKSPCAIAAAKWRIRKSAPSCWTRSRATSRHRQGRAGRSFEGRQVVMVLAPR